jgi:hypothetical protein
MSVIQLISLSILLGLALFTIVLIPYLVWRSKGGPDSSFMDFLFKD